MCNCPKQHTGTCVHEGTTVPRAHKWAKEIKAWADGAEIERRCPNSPHYSERVWTGISIPGWSEHWEYRVKEKEKNYGELAKTAWFKSSHEPFDPARWDEVAKAVIDVFTERNF